MSDLRRSVTCALLGLGTSHEGLHQAPSTKHHIFPTSNMADDLVQAGEQEIQEYFDAAVNVAKQAGQVIK